MRIVDVNPFYSPYGGGVRTYVDHKLKAFAAMGHEFICIMPGVEDGEKEYPGGARVISIASPALAFDRRYRWFSSSSRLLGKLDELKPDMLECASPWRAATLVGEWQGDAPRSLIMHADPFAAYAYRWFEPLFKRETIDQGISFFWNHLRRVGECYDRVVCANPELAGRLADGGVPNTVTIPMGIEPGVFSPALRDPALRAELLQRCSLGPEATLLLGVGRHSSEKRWPVVLNAVMAVQAKHQVGMVLVGEGRDRGLLEREIGGNPHILLQAPLTDRDALARVMASSDALVHGSDAETFGLVTAEAVASGLPLVVPNGGGAPLFANPSFAEVYRPGDVLSAAEAIERLLRRDPARLRAAAAAAAAHSRTLDDHFRDLADLYATFPRRTSPALPDAADRVD